MHIKIVASIKFKVLELNKKKKTGSSLFHELQ